MRPPKELLEQRPVLIGDESVVHPATHEVIAGKPPAKYTKAVHDRICEELSKGQRAQGACARAGITTATFYEWVRRGKEGDPYLWQFAHDVEIAINTAEADALDVVTDIGFRNPDPDARDVEKAQWFLERARADGYSKQVKTQVESQVRDFMIRLENALLPLPARMMTGSELFELVLAVYVGQTPSGILDAKSITTPLLVEHVETGSTEELSAEFTS